ncbi:dimethylaniline monooxygenase [N-oxide-forming] 2-like isoform X2 [Mizuhopecten yessoensis]|uniref:dimethylaniline monooxygenase [N-oxide-forming] 2-like isoform X2 n=1 Tax=Mizuhopecten yessoensis TaxID=6573 RepID=UPI000B45E9CD|nr:dimethylaniline monooxygenase [N-oxide-forming] 2-like isoform X2 [Mizuhopecten yessoensis]
MFRFVRLASTQSRISFSTSVSDFERTWMTPVGTKPTNRVTRTNGPKQLMTIPGYPHDQSGNSYLHHPQILKYVKGFTDHFDLGQYVKLNTITKSIRPVPTDGDHVQWDVTYCNRHNVNEIDTQRFDGVIVSTGHYSKSHIPEVKGMDKFTGSVIHSRDYRRPDVYEGKRVLIIGASFSGLDIAFDLSKKAKKIYMGHRDAGLQTKIPANVAERPDVSHLLEGNRVVFKDGSEEDIDDIILCTGYSYSFPFLADDVIQLKDERITPLYKHLVHIKYNNLLFVGLARCVSYFAQSHEQARAASIILEGNVKFPSQQEMLEDADRDFEQKRKEFDMTHLHAHYMGKGDLQWRMNKDHAELCGFETVPQVVKDMLEHVQNTRTLDFGNFRKRNYFYKDPHTFEVSK